jgi:hypothetical protein
MGSYMMNKNYFELSCLLLLSTSCVAHFCVLNITVLKKQKLNKYFNLSGVFCSKIIGLIGFDLKEK